MRTKTCAGSIRAGRLAKAEQFQSAALLVLAGASGDDDLADAYVTLCVHAGIAAADVICCARLGEHSQGEHHADAVTLLRRADKPASDQLSALLALKTKSGYSHATVTSAELRRAGRAAASLLDSARRAHAARTGG